MYPNGGESPGWYGLSWDLANSGDPFIETHLAGSKLSYEQRQAGALPPFVIYEQMVQPAPPRFTPGGLVRVGLLTFLGHSYDSDAPAQADQAIEVRTWWQVDSVPVRPLSIMLHLTGPGGTPFIVGDGLGVPVQIWQVGDIIVQRHKLSLPADMPQGEYTLTTGVYWLDTFGHNSELLIWRAISWPELTGLPHLNPVFVRFWGAMPHGLRRLVIHDRISATTLDNISKCGMIK
jgi:hypothetical protein